MAKKMTNTKSKPRTKLRGMAKPAGQLSSEQAKKIRGGETYQIISAGRDIQVKK